MGKTESKHEVQTLRASLVAQTVKHLSAVQETWVRPLDWEDPLEEGMGLQYSCLENPHGQRCLAGYSPQGPQTVWPDWATKHSTLSVGEKNFKYVPDKRWKLPLYKGLSYKL